MTTPHKRSKRQLYIGIFFIVAAILAALLRSIGPSGTVSDQNYVRVDELIGISLDQTIDRLGEPTAQLSFSPGDDPNPMREQVTQVLRDAGKAVPELILEASWFNPDSITTVWYVEQSDEGGFRSIDSVRYARRKPDDQAVPALD